MGDFDGFAQGDGVQGSPRDLVLAEFRDVDFFKGEKYKKIISFCQESEIRNYFQENIYNVYKKYVRM